MDYYLRVVFTRLDCTKDLNFVIETYFEVKYYIYSSFLIIATTKINDDDYHDDDEDFMVTNMSYKRCTKSPDSLQNSYQYKNS